MKILWMRPPVYVDQWDWEKGHSKWGAVTQRLLEGKQLKKSTRPFVLTELAVEARYDIESISPK